MKMYTSVKADGTKPQLVVKMFKRVWRIAIDKRLRLQVSAIVIMIASIISSRWMILAGFGFGIWLMIAGFIAGLLLWIQAHDIRER